jgi:hypothetical protein
MGRSGVVWVLALVALGACGGRAALPRACAEAQTADVLRALVDAPATVALEDGTPLSRCVARAIDESQLQVLGATLTSAAARLARQAERSEAAALQLGFLIGATERGAGRTAGFQGELANRIAQTAAPTSAPHGRALLRGLAAGRAHG